MLNDDVIQFSLEIERLVEENDISYIDAVILYCEKTGLEEEVAAKLVVGSLKSKIKIEAEDLHFLVKPNTRRLQI